MEEIVKRVISEINSNTNGIDEVSNYCVGKMFASKA